MIIMQFKALQLLHGMKKLKRSNKLIFKIKSTLLNQKQIPLLKRNNLKNGERYTWKHLKKRVIR